MAPNNHEFDFLTFKVSLLAESHGFDSYHNPFFVREQNINTKSVHAVLHYRNQKCIQLF